jgi:hypothetical protein
VLGLSPRIILSLRSGEVDDDPALGYSVRGRPFEYVTDVSGPPKFRPTYQWVGGVSTCGLGKRRRAGKEGHSLCPGKRRERATSPSPTYLKFFNSGRLNPPAVFDLFPFHEKTPGDFCLFLQLGFLRPVASPSPQPESRSPSCVQCDGYVVPLHHAPQKWRDMVRQDVVWWGSISARRHSISISKFMDFFLRSHLWEQRIFCSSKTRLSISVTARPVLEIQGRNLIRRVIYFRTICAYI